MKRRTLLFLGTTNSTRSQMAEGWARSLASELPDYLEVEVHSAGSEVHGLNPRAVAAMAEHGVDISQHHSKAVTEQMLQDADWIITVCAEADRKCPEPGSGRRKVHIPFEDPLQAADSEAEIESRFNRLAVEIRSVVAGLLRQVLLGVLQQSRGSVYDQADVVTETREAAYEGFIPVDVLHLRHRLFAGGWSDVMRRELALRPSAVGVLLYDPQRENLVMVKQFRTGVLGAGQSPWMLEIVAGLADADEEPLEVAKREAREEANCEISEAVPICEYFNSPGWCDEKINLFCAVVDSQLLQGIHGLDEEHEDILIVTIPLEEAIEMTHNGQINNAMSLIAIQWLQLNLHRFHNN